MLLPKAAKSKAFSQAKTGKFLSKVKSSLASKAGKPGKEASKDLPLEGPSQDPEPVRTMRCWARKSGLSQRSQDRPALAR